jgi:A/G-specific adenine glycosylase
MGPGLQLLREGVAGSLGEECNALLSWFAANARTLPWRDAPAGARDPYRVWVSEIMLQQTRVETELRYYARFLAAFPDARTLAAADEERVMKAWEGLGYYRRARFLHAAAKVVARSGMPTSAATLAKLPGFGPYTAGAVASLAYNERAPAVDGNVLRVFARQTGVARPTRAAAEAWVMRHQPAARAGAFNEALMELGATVCTPRAPSCGACPIAASCATKSDRVPLAAKKARVPTVRVSLALARRGTKLLLEKRDTGLLAGTWGLPWVEGGPRALASHVRALVGAPVRVRAAPARRGSHTFTHRKWAMELYVVETKGRAGSWRAPGEMALGSAHRKLLADEFS